jgi:hypothetical protein
MAEPGEDRDDAVTRTQRLGDGVRDPSDAGNLFGTEIWRIRVVQHPQGNSSSKAVGMLDLVECVVVNADGQLARFVRLDGIVSARYDRIEVQVSNLAPGPPLLVVRLQPVVSLDGAREKLEGLPEMQTLWVTGDFARVDVARAGARTGGADIEELPSMSKTLIDRGSDLPRERCGRSTPR